MYYISYNCRCTSQVIYLSPQFRPVLTCQWLNSSGQENKNIPKTGIHLHLCPTSIYTMYASHLLLLVKTEIKKLQVN